MMRHSPVARRLVPVLLCMLWLMAMIAIDVPTVLGQTDLRADRSRPEATPTGEQVLRLAGPARDIGVIDPAQVRDLDAGFYSRQIFRGLMRFDESLNPVPELAERVVVSEDGLRYRFTLDPDAVFHDGRSITAADVVASFTRALDPETVGGDPSLLAGSTYLSDITGAGEVMANATDELVGAVAVDDRTVELGLDQPRSTFLMKLAGVAAAVVDPRQAETGGEWWRAPNGSGPFSVLTWTPAEMLVLGRFERYVGGPPYLERIEVRLGAQAVQAFNLFQSGAIDLARVPNNAIDRLLDPADPLNTELRRTPQFALRLIAFDPNIEPMSDPHVRRAVQLAFPQDKIASVMFGGRVEDADGLIPPGMLGETWPATVETFDLTEARAEIGRSRYGRAEAVPAIRIYGGDPVGAMALSDALGEELRLRVEVIEVDWSDLLDGLSRREFSAFELYWGADYPDPETFLLSLFGSASADNYINYDQPEFDALLHEAASTSNTAERAVFYQDAQTMLLRDRVAIPLYFDVRFDVVNPAVQDLTITALGILSLESIWMER